MKTKIICSFCNKEITEEQQRKGFFAGDKKAWNCYEGYYESKPTHSHCNFPAIVTHFVEKGYWKPYECVET